MTDFFFNFQMFASPCRRLKKEALLLAGFLNLNFAIFFIAGVSRPPKKVHEGAVATPD
jgi:hypothetical protein